MLYNMNPRKLLVEATAMLDPEVNDVVKDVVDDLDETLQSADGFDKKTGTVQDGADKSDKVPVTTNGGIPVTEAAAAVFECKTATGKKAYIVTLETVMAIMETEGEAAAQAAMEEPGEAPSEEAVEEAEPTAPEVVENIADANGIETKVKEVEVELKPEGDGEAQTVAVAINYEQVKMLANSAVLEAKCGKKGDDALATKKLKKVGKAVKQLKEAGIKLIRA